MKRRQSFATILVGKRILLREGLAKILRSANFRILASVSCVDDLVPNKLQSHPPLFLVVHTSQGFEAAVEQIELLRDQYPGGRIAIVTDHFELDGMVTAFRAGANGYFLDGVTCDVFIKSIELVMMGETIFPPLFLSFVLGHEAGHISEMVLRDERNQAILVTTEDSLAPKLSAREKSILRCLVEGGSNKCIARKMDIAEATVKVHVKAILRKIGVQNRTQAAIWGMSNGSLPRPANDSALPSILDVSKPASNSVEVISEIDQIEAPVRPAAIEHEPNQVEVPRIVPLIRKAFSRRTQRAARPGK